MCEHHAGETRKDGSVFLTRRQLVSGLAAGSVVALSGCVTNPETGRSQLMLVSDGQLSQAAAASWQQIKRKERISRDPALNARVRGIGSRIVSATGRSTAGWEFVVFDSDQINAFAMPGGRVGVYTGIINVMDNDDQLATVLGHEVGHVTARHSAERYSQALAAQVGATITQVVVSDEDARMASAIFGAGVTFGILLPYSRQHELEADKLGVVYMHRAGFRAEESVRFWQNMSRAKQGSGSPPEFMSTHPADSTRIALLRQEVARIQRREAKGKSI